MPPERGPLALAAQRKSTDAVTRARATISGLHQAGADITFQAVAQHAGVSRQWLYKNTELRAEIEKLRGRRMGARRVPAAQRASDASLRQRNQTLADDNKRLRAENAELKAELAILLGQHRGAGPPTTRRPHRSRGIRQPDEPGYADPWGDPTRHPRS